MLLTLQHLGKKQALLIKEKRYFWYKKSDYISYNCSIEEKIVTILENIKKNSNSQKKTSFF